MQTRRLFLLSLPALASLRLPLSEASAAPAVTGATQGKPAGSGAEILPQIELVSGVLAHTDWIKRRGPRGEPSRYFRELQAWFAPFRTHHAIKQAAELTRRGFTYDAPPAFALHLGTLPELPLAHRYSDALIKRADGRAVLEEFRQALGDLARESDFARFLSNHRKDYERWCAAARFDKAKATGWLERLYGRSDNDFRLVLAPAMYPDGGYGPTVTTAEGRRIVCQVVRVSRDEKGEPVFPRDNALMSLSLHEWGHSFVNPAMEAHAGRVRGLEPLLVPVRDLMRKQAYGTVDVFLNEQVLRATTLLAYDRDGVLPASDYPQRLLYEEKRGFYLTAQIVAWLKEDYVPKRGAYPDFASYVPALIARLEEEAKRRAATAAG